jgi:hypothetical protein
MQKTYTVSIGGTAGQMASKHDQQMPRCLAGKRLPEQVTAYKAFPIARAEL